MRLFHYIASVFRQLGRSLFRPRLSAPTLPTAPPTYAPVDPTLADSDTTVVGPSVADTTLLTTPTADDRDASTAEERQPPSEPLGSWASRPRAREAGSRPKLTPPAPDDPGPQPGQEKLRLGKVLGNPGGQGTVYQLLDHPGWVYKKYKKPMPQAADVFVDLVRAGNEIREQLPDRIHTVWPTTVRSEGSTVQGYVMREIPRDFHLQLNSPYRSQKALALLEHALPVDPSVVFRPATEATDAERVETAILVGQFLDTLHRNDLVYGDLSLKNVLWALKPTRVLIMDIDSVHRLTSRLIDEKDLVSTPDWGDPESQTTVPLGFDLDRYKYALLVYRLLVVQRPASAPPTDIDKTPKTLIPGLSTEQTEDLWSLLARAAGPHGSRPPVSEWLTVLAGREAPLEEIAS